MQTIESFVKSVPTSTLSLPKYDDVDETRYNKRVAKSQKGYLALLDQNFIQYPSRGKVEVCDLFTSDRIFIHVKRCGASGTLSHLFAQGTVSAQLMVREANFREQFYTKIPSTHRWGDPKNAIHPSQFEVCFAIVCRPGQSLTLPFFSKVSLRTAVQNLTQLGFKVSLAAIPS